MPVTIQPATLKIKNGNAYYSSDALKGDPGDVTIVAEDYSDLTFPVAAGKLCTHENKLYKANQAITTSEAWTAAHWDATTIEEEIANSGGGGTMLVTITDDSTVSDKTADEIVAAIVDGHTIYLLDESSGDYPRSAYVVGYSSDDHNVGLRVYLTPDECYDYYIADSNGSTSVTIEQTELVRAEELVATWDILLNQNISISSGTPNYAIITDYTDAIQANQTYRITWGTDEYYCDTFDTAQGVTYDGFGFGNLGIAGGTDTGEPFLFYRDTNSRLLCATTASTGTKHLTLELKSGEGLVDDSAGVGDKDKTLSADKLSKDITSLKTAINVMKPEATAEDVGKALIVKTVEDGEVTEYEYGEAGGGGTSDYADLTNKPKINNVELSGNKTGANLGLLNAPSTAGTSGQVLMSDGNGGQAWGTPGTGTILVDSTLSVSGAAADAKATGDVKDALAKNIGEAQVAQIYDSTKNTASKYYYIDSGNMGAAWNRVCTEKMDIVDGYEYYYSGLTTVNSTYEHVVFWNYDGVCLGGLNLATGENKVAIPVGAVKFAFSFYYEDVSLFKLNKYYAIGGRIAQDENDIEYANGLIEEAFKNQITFGDVPTYTIEDKSKYIITNGVASKDHKDSYNAAYKVISPLPVHDGVYYRIGIVSGDNYPIIFVDENYKVLDAVTIASTIAQFRTEKSGFVPYGTKYILINKFGGSSDWIFLWNNNPFYGKKVAIIGDSVSCSTADNYSPPIPNTAEMIIEDEDVGVSLSAYPTYYDVSAGLVLGEHTFTTSDLGSEITFTPTESDVGKKIGRANSYPNEFPWWTHVSRMLGFTPIPVCWSGSSITSHEKNTDDRKCSWAWHESQIRKCGTRTPGTMTRTAPDYIIVFRGCNDMTHSPYTILTDNYFKGIKTYPADDAIDGGYGFKEGYYKLIGALRSAYPNAVIYLCTLTVFKRVSYSSFPTNNGINSLPDYNNAIREVAEYTGCRLIEFDKCGITFENCYSGGYITDSATTPTHPSTKGHVLMSAQAIKDMVNH